MVCWPTMSPANLVWLRFRALWSLWVLLAVLLAPWSTWAVVDFQLCSWKVILSKFKSVGDPNVHDRFIDQKPVDSVSKVFKTLGDSPIDLQEKYLGFPYYLKINFSCVGQHSEDLVRSGHLMGLKPMVLVNFQYPVNFYRWKIEKLQILMEAAPLPNKGPCGADAVCSMSWYTPMPIKNGSVVMRVDISGNGLGPFIPTKRFYVNVNGFLRKEWSGKISFTIGEELPDLRTWSFPSSRPLWYTKSHTPVLILGGIENEKMVLVTDTNFQDYSLVELSIDSCWVNAFFCPFTAFSSTIQDTISTESTLFIRQNQLVYYFTGRYTTLFSSNRGSNNWVRVLASECIKQLCPVFVNGDGAEYMLALSTGRHEGYVHMGTITDSQTLNTLYTMPKFIPNGRNGRHR